MVPAVIMTAFFMNVPLSWKISEAKSRLKIVSVIAVCVVIMKNDVIMNRLMISIKSTLVKVLSITIASPLCLSLISN